MKFPQLSHLFDFISHRQTEFQWGWNIVGLTSSVIGFETFAMVFCGKFGIYGYPSLLIYLGIPVLALIGITFLGHNLIKSGYAHKYQQYNANVNQDWVNSVEDIRWIRKELERQKTR
jgi:hypothetical protein